jgi:hypothetical protein
MALNQPPNSSTPNLGSRAWRRRFSRTGAPVLDLWLSRASIGQRGEIRLLDGFDPRITFSRASNATMFDSQGRLVWAPANMFPSSRMIAGSYFSQSSSVLSSVSTVGPLGDIRLVGRIVTNNGISNAGNDGTGGVSMTALAILQGAVHVFSFYAKAAEVTQIRVREAASLGSRAFVDLITGAVTADLGVVDNSVTGINVTSENVGNGWWRITTKRTASGTTTNWNIKSGDATGDGVRGFLVSSCQLEYDDASAPKRYQETTGSAYYGPRLDYNPATLTARGLLVEEARTNYLLQSSDLASASWVKTDATPTKNQVGLSGAANSAFTVQEGSAGTAFLAQDGSAVPADSQLSGCAVLKLGNTSWVRVGIYGGGFTNYSLAWFNLSAGTVGTVSNVGTSTGGVASITSLGGGWYRCAITCSPGGGYTIPKIAVVSATADASTTRVANATWLFDSAQVEVGAFATSYIPTFGSAATRAAESAGASAISWLNALAGTMAVEHEIGARTTASAFPRVFQVDDGTAVSNNNRWSYGLLTGVPAMFADVVVAGANQASPSLAGIFGGAQKIAYSLTLNNARYSRSGAAVASDSAISVPNYGAAPQLAIASFSNGPGSYSNASGAVQWISRIRYWPRADFTDAQLQALST